MTETFNDKTETRQITGRRCGDGASGRRALRSRSPELGSLENLTLGCRAFVLDPGGAASPARTSGARDARLTLTPQMLILTIESVFN